MGKRPTGFGKASKEKKLKSEANRKPEENEAELNIELTEDVDDEELAEIYGLYTKLQEERDPKIARGLIHECDQTLRIRDSQNQTLPDKFHVVYGGALLTLADPSHESDHKQFRDAGVERINVGLTSGNAEVVALAGLELVQLAHTQTKEGEMTPAGKKVLKHAISLLKKRKGQHHVELGKAAFKLLQLLDDIDSEQLEKAEDAAEVAFAVLDSQIKSDNAEIRRWGHKGLGQYYLNLAAPALAEDEDNDEKEKTGNGKETQKQVDQAIEHLRKSLSETDQESYVMLAETLLEAAGLKENEDDTGEDTDEIYAEALKHLKKARLLGNDGLTEVIESLENPE